MLQLRMSDAKQRHGQAENITNEAFEKAAGVMGLSAEESKKNALELLQKVLA